MRLTTARRLGGGICLALLPVLSASAAAPAPPAPQPPETVPQMLEFDWAAGPPMPQGMQDNHVEILGRWMVSAGGFCSGSDRDWKPEVYPRGFLDKVWALDLRAPANGWKALPPLPGAPRQAMHGAIAGGALYVWGGFSYSAPYTYKDGYRLRHAEGQWTWDTLPELPHPTAWGATCAIGPRIYTCGGADYDRKRFHTDTSRDGAVARYGALLHVLDTRRLKEGWKELRPCPGTPRCLAGLAAARGKIYLVGGVAAPAGQTALCNVVDSWRYDPGADAWERLRDLPISGSGSTATNHNLYQDRYLILPCGYQYGTYLEPDGKVAPKYGTPSTVERAWKSHPKFEDTHYYNHCYVYDLETGLYGTATDLPFDDVASVTLVHQDTVYILPGETAGFEWKGQYYGHHPEFVLKGTISVCDWQ